MRARWIVFQLPILLLALPALGRPPRPHLGTAAQALLARGPAFLSPGDNLLVPLDGGKPIPFVEPAPTKLELLPADPVDGLVLLDGDLYRLQAGKLGRVASEVGAMPAVSPDLAWVAGIEDQHVLKLQHGDEVRRIPYHRDGRWELTDPFFAPDGSRLLVTLHDSSAALDTYGFLLVDVKSGTFDEVHLSQSFAPGTARRAVDGDKVALPMWTQDADSDGAVRYGETDPVVFDLGARKITPAPAGVEPGRVPPGGRFTLAPGPKVWSEDRRCAADETRLWEKGQAKPARFVQDGQVVTLLDLLPDGQSAIASVLSLKTCKSRAVLLPLDGKLPPARWKPFALPPREGRMEGRLIH
jgi:hypothetical protein